MTSEEYIKQQIAAGYDIHFHDNVWWMKEEPFFYRTVNPLQVLNYGKARPKMYKALLGYKYIVDNNQYANKYYQRMVLNEERFHKFGIQSLSSSKRAQVRKGLKLTEIRKIEAIDTVIDDIKEICISTHVRTGYGRSEKYFNKHYKEWRSSVTKQFSATKKERWGVFYEKTLIAFMNVIQIDDTLIIDNAASHTAHLDKCPNDAILFSVLENYREVTGCNRVMFGDWSGNAPSLNAFKQKFGFEKVDFPVYLKCNPIVKVVKRINYLLRRNDSKDFKH